MRYLTFAFRLIFVIFIIAVSSCSGDNFYILFENDDLRSTQVLEFYAQSQNSAEESEDMLTNGIL